MDHGLEFGAPVCRFVRHSRELVGELPASDLSRLGCK